MALEGQERGKRDFPPTFGQFGRSLIMGWQIGSIS